MKWIKTDEGDYLNLEKIAQLYVVGDENTRWEIRANVHDSYSGGDIVGYFESKRDAEEALRKIIKYACKEEG